MSRQEQVFIEGSPVRYNRSGEWRDFPMRFKWQEGIWFDLFEKHVEFIVQDIERARANDRLVMYFSCPISSRFGGCSLTNIEIAIYTADSLKVDFGTRLWTLNPVLYQMESKGGTGLMKRHARLLSLERRLRSPIDVDRLARAYPITGGDYLRMWSRVLVEDGDKNLGQRIDAYYFLGPNDVRRFFTKDGSVSLTEGIESYFVRKFILDKDFARYFKGYRYSDPEWQKRRDDFFNFYSLKASAAYSLGSRDEYNIWRALNDIRAKELGAGHHIPGYFDGQQLEPGTAEPGGISGYALPNHS